MESSSLPKQLCLECLSKLNHFNEFFTQTMENQIILEILFGEKSEIINNDLTSPKKDNTKIQIQASTQTDEQVKSSLDDNSQFYIIEEVTEDSQSNCRTEEDITYEADEEISQEIQSAVQLIDQSEAELSIINLRNSKSEDSNNIFNISAKRRRFDRFDCYLCEQKLSGNYQFIQHFASEHPTEEIKYQCYICKGFVKKYRSYTRHIESHTEKRFEYVQMLMCYSQLKILAQTFFLFRCDVCNQKFSQKITLVTHLSSHSKLKNFQCDECNISFKQNSSLFKHRKQKHSNDIPECNICNRKFVNKETYEQHLKSKHNQQMKDIVCIDCNKKFASKSALSYHRLSIHPKDKQKTAKCKECSDEFKNNIILARHIKKCHK